MSQGLKRGCLTFWSLGSGPGARSGGGVRVGAVLEYVHLRVKEGAQEEFVARRGDVEVVLGGMTGFLAAELVRLEDGTWLDLVHWATSEDAKAAAALFPSLTQAHPWANLIAEVKVVTHGQVTNATDQRLR